MHAVALDTTAVPYVTDGNIYAPVMLAERSADLVLGRRPLGPEHVDFYRHETARPKPEHGVEHPAVPAQDGAASRDVRELQQPSLAV